MNKAYNKDKDQIKTQDHNVKTFSKLQGRLLASKQWVKQGKVLQSSKTSLNVQDLASGEIVSLNIIKSNKETRSLGISVFYML